MIPAEPDPDCTGVGIEMKHKTIANVLTIAGSDSSGGAGIQADLKAFAAQGVYGASVITAVTAQNTQAVTAVHYIPPKIIQAQLEAVLSDINISAIKIGMLGHADAIRAISATLDSYPHIPVIIDPVMISKSGNALLQPDAVELLVSALIPKALMITPNLPEAAVLAAVSEPSSLSEMEALLPGLHSLGAQYVLLKGGHLDNARESTDLLYDGKTMYPFVSQRVETKNTHGTGCTFSAAIAANVAKGLPVSESVSIAKDYLTTVIQSADALSVGKGHGPLNHFSSMWNLSFPI